ncbi:MAG: GIY-YIG nuclease family protein [Cycloclasticus sp.]
MALPDYGDLEAAIKKFNRKYKRPAMTIGLSDEFDLNEHYNDLEEWYKGKIGVYILFNEKEEIIRIGSATNDLYSRLNCYFDYKDSTETKGMGWWKEGVSSRYIHTIEVPKEQSFEALAIEKYLLDELKPPLNKEGKVVHIAYREKMASKLIKIRKQYGWTQDIKKWHTLSTRE